MTQLKNKATVAYKELGSNLTKTSNEVVFDIIGNNLTVVKSQTPVIGPSGTTVNFTITLTNNGLNPITNITLTDALTSVGYTYVTGTLKINGVSTNGDPNNGISIADMQSLAVTIVKFDATVN